MNGGRNRRFPRTAQAMPGGRPSQTIEREKIRHRRPNDMMFDEGETQTSRRSFLTDDDVAQIDNDDRYVEEAEEAWADQTDDDWTDHAEDDWSDRDDDAPKATAWDDEAEDQWVLDGDEPAVEVFQEEDVYQEEDDDEGGVVWEDDAFTERRPDDGADEMVFEVDDRPANFAPEVELAGRRDVRPSPPRPAPPPGARLSKRQPNRQQRQKPRSRQAETHWDVEEWRDVEEQPTSIELPAQETTVARPSQRRGLSPDGGPVTKSSGNHRFSRTQATLGTSSGGTSSRDAGADEEMLQQPRRSPGQRRRQAQPAHARPAHKRQALPAASKMAGRRYSPLPNRSRGRGLILAVVLLLVAGGGYLAYQQIGGGGLQPMIDRLTSLLPLPGTSRTAADTSFGQQDGDAAFSPEQALAELEQRLEQQQASQTTSRADGPPIPKFKPLPGATRSLSVDAGTTTGEQAQIVASGDEESAGEPSIFERFLRYFSPG